MDNIENRKIMKIYFTFLFFIIFFASSLIVPSSIGEQIQRETPEYRKDYKFTADWFSHNIRVWKKHLSQFKAKPNIQYLEIGVYEGRSLIWMLENILTNPASRITCIDTFPKDLKKRFLYNLKISGCQNRVSIIRGKSQIKLRKFPFDSFDIIYIDGSHYANDVLADAVLSWPLLKTDGLLIFDDYSWEQSRPVELRPQIAIDAFITAYRNSIDVVHHEYQVILRKRRLSKAYYFPIGSYVYDWNQKNLFHSETKMPIKLQNKERDFIETIIGSRNFGDVKYSTDSEFLENKDVQNLIKRLKLDFLNPKKKNLYEEKDWEDGKRCDIRQQF